MRIILKLLINSEIQEDAFKEITTVCSSMKMNNQFGIQQKVQQNDFKVKTNNQ